MKTDNWINYCEADATYYHPEGWSEMINNWEDYTFVTIHNQMCDCGKPIRYSTHSGMSDTKNTYADTKNTYANKVDWLSDKDEN